MSPRCCTSLHSNQCRLPPCSPPPPLPAHPPQFTTLFIRAVRVRRFETLSRQDFFQFLVVGLVCGMIWWVLPLAAATVVPCSRWPAVRATVGGLCHSKDGQSVSAWSWNVSEACTGGCGPLHPWSW